MDENFNAPENGGEYTQGGTSVFKRVIALVAVGLIFIAFQFRHEIANFFRKIFKKSQK